jgi:hypothetical protein
MKQLTGHGPSRCQRCGVTWEGPWPVSDRKCLMNKLGGAPRRIKKAARCAVITTLLR